MSLFRMYAGYESVIEVAAMASLLPRAGAVNEWLGGWGAVSAEDEALRRVEYLLQVQLMQASGSKRKLPPPKAPSSRRDAAVRALSNKRNRDRVSRMKNRWR